MKFANLLRQDCGNIKDEFTPQQLEASVNLSGAVGTLLSSQGTGTWPDNAKPKAFLSWMFLDEQFKLVAQGSGVDPVGEAVEFKEHAFVGLEAPKSGYFYVYVSNESPYIPVYFDNLQVTHARSPLVEETHYYPFGLVMKGISHSVPGFPENKLVTFQGQEICKDLGVEGLEFKFRMHDPQTGRFWQVDPLSEKYVHNSTYAFSENRVTTHIELEGLEGVWFHDAEKNRNVIMHNVVILAEKKKEGNTPKENRKIDARTNGLLEAVRKDLNVFFNGGMNGEGTKGKDGVLTYFQFNFSVQEVDDPSRISMQETAIIARENRLESGVQLYNDGGSEWVGASVVTQKKSQGMFGHSPGYEISVNSNAPEGSYAHEIGHKFKLFESFDYQAGSLMKSPPEPISADEVDESLKNSLKLKRQ